MKGLKHYKLNSERGVTEKKKRTYIAKCGSSKLLHGDMSSTLAKVTCPECILQLMTDFETKIAILEDRYEELWPNRPVGERLQ